MIIAEGFDPSHVLGTTNMDITNLSIRKENIIGTLNIGDPNIWENISSFDIIYLDYNDGLDDIRRNAVLFQEVIDYVNRNKEGASPNVVMGISMGGLVARYALRKMELENSDVAVFNAQGMLVAQQQQNRYETRIPFGNEAKGVYFVRIQAGQAVATHKVVHARNK